jgi:hypothetical protein
MERMERDTFEFLKMSRARQKFELQNGGAIRKCVDSGLRRNQ